MWKSALACFAAGSVAGAVAFIDDNRVTVAEVLFVVFFVAGMALIALGGNPYRNDGARPLAGLFRRKL